MGYAEWENFDGSKWIKVKFIDDFMEFNANDYAWAKRNEEIPFSSPGLKHTWWVLDTKDKVMVNIAQDLIHEVLRQVKTGGKYVVPSKGEQTSISRYFNTMITTLVRQFKSGKRVVQRMDSEWIFYRYANNRATNLTHKKAVVKLSLGSVWAVNKERPNLVVTQEGGKDLVFRFKQDTIQQLINKSKPYRGIILF